MLHRRVLIASTHPNVPCTVYFFDGKDMQWLQIDTEVYHEYDTSDVDIWVEYSIPIFGKMAAGSESFRMESVVFLRGF